MSSIDLSEHINLNHLEGSASPVELSDIYDRQGRAIPFVRGVIRTDTGEPISVVGHQYTLVPHNRLLTAIDRAVSSLGLTDDQVPRGTFFSQRGAKARALYRFPTLARDLVPGDRLCPMI